MIHIFGAVRSRPRNLGNDVLCFITLNNQCLPQCNNIIESTIPRGMGKRTNARWSSFHFRSLLVSYPPSPAAGRTVMTDTLTSHDMA